MSVVKLYGQPNELVFKIFNAVVLAGGDNFSSILDTGVGGKLTGAVYLATSSAGATSVVTVKVQDSPDGVQFFDEVSSSNTLTGNGTLVVPFTIRANQFKVDLSLNGAATATAWVVMDAQVAQNLGPVT